MMTNQQLKKLPSKSALAELFGKNDRMKSPFLHISAQISEDL